MSRIFAGSANTQRFQADRSRAAVFSVLRQSWPLLRPPRSDRPLGCGHSPACAVPPPIPARRFPRSGPQYHMGEVRTIVFQQLLVVRDDQDAHLLPPISVMLWLASRTASTSRPLSVSSRRRTWVAAWPTAGSRPASSRRRKSLRSHSGGQIPCPSATAPSSRSTLCGSAHGNQLFPFLAVGPAELVAAWPGNRPSSRPGIDIGRWNARKMPGPSLFVGSISSTSAPSSVNAALGHFVARVPHDGVTQRALTRAVGSHQCVNFAAADLQIHPPAGLVSLRPTTCKSVIVRVSVMFLILANHSILRSPSEGVTRYFAVSFCGL